MKIDVNKIFVNKLTIGRDDEFMVGKNVGKRIYIPTDFFDVDEIFSEAGYDHEELSEAYVKSNKTLVRDFENFKSQTRDTSYKDFLIFRNEAIAVADKNSKGQPEIITDMNSNSGSMKKILKAYLNKGYNLKNSNNPLQNFNLKNY